jgi:hypothetical protein
LQNFLWNHIGFHKNSWPASQGLCSVMLSAVLPKSCVVESAFYTQGALFCTKEITWQLIASICWIPSFSIGFGGRSCVPLHGHSSCPASEVTISGRPLKFRIVFLAHLNVPVISTLEHCWLNFIDTSVCTIGMRIYI